MKTHKMTKRKIEDFATLKYQNKKPSKFIKKKRKIATLSLCETSYNKIENP
jgi:hypothetical protein